MCRGVGKTEGGLGHWLQFRGTAESEATEEGLSSWDQMLAGRRGDLWGFRGLHLHLVCPVLTLGTLSGPWSCLRLPALYVC